MTDLGELSADEIESLRVAVLSAYYSALDEERSLRTGIEYGGLSPEARERAEESRADAALRAHRFSLLVDKVLAARATLSSSVTPVTPGTVPKQERRP